MEKTRFFACFVRMFNTMCFAICAVLFSSNAYSTCATGYHEQTNPLDSTIYNKIMVGFIYRDPTTETDFASYTTNYHTTNYATGIWVSAMKNPDSQLLADTYVGGHAFCAATGSENDYDKSRTTFATSNNITTTEPGSYCWCQLYALNVYNWQYFSGTWVALNNLGSHDNCANNTCAQECANEMHNNPSFRQAIYSVPYCVADDTPHIYPINYYNVAHATWNLNQNHPYGYTTGQEITLGIPSRQNYDFVAWCDNAELTENCMFTKTIPADSVGTKSFYAKWDFANSDCQDGYKHVCLINFDVLNQNRLGYAYKPIDGSEVQTEGDKTTETYNLTQPGEWGVSFEHGDLKGISKCAATASTSDGNGHHCWCKTTDFIPSDTEDTTCHSEAGLWTYSVDSVNDDSCSKNCPKSCVKKNPVTDNLFGRNSYFWEYFANENLSECAIDKYKINYVLNGGLFPNKRLSFIDMLHINDVSAPTTYQITDTVLIPRPARENFVFGGWYTEPDFSGEPIFDGFGPGEFGNITLYAKWIEKTCSEHYTLSYPANIEGTRRSSSGNKWEVTFPFGVVSGTGYTSQWDNNRCVCKATSFTPKNGTTQDIVFAPEGAVGGTTNCAYYCSHYIATKTTNHIDTRTPTFAGTVLQDPVCLPIEYTIHFESNGGTSYSDRHYNVESGNITLPEPARRGYHFDGWYEEEDFSGTSVIIVSTDTADNKTFYAKWSFIGCPAGYVAQDTDSGKICQPITYTIHFVSNSVLNFDDIPYTIESEDIELPTDILEQNGLPFVGWYEDDSFSEPAITLVPKGSTGDKTFYAKWLQNTCSTDNTTANNLISLVDVETRGSEFAALDDGRCVSPGYNGVMSEASNACQNLISTYNFNHGDWFVIFDYGKLQGRGICSNTTGNIGATADTVTETSNGSYCWCNITKFTPTNGITRETTSPWFSVGSQSGCSTNCAQTCGAGTFKNHNNFYNVVKPAYYLTNVCNAPVYTIHYNSNYGTEYEDQQYTAIYDTITLPTPTRAGYDFDGWYDNANFEGEPVTQVVSGSIGNKTFWAKWNFIGCSTGYIEQETNGVKTCVLIKHSITYIYEDTELDLEPSTYDITTLGTNLPSAPQGYTNFIGWCLDSSTCFSTIDKIPNNWTGDKVLYLKKCPENYKLGTPFSVNEPATKWAAKSALTGDAASASAYGLTAHGEWGATFDSGYIVGTSLCSQTPGGTMGAVGQPDETGEGDTKYCWCRVTKYGFPEREVNTTRWVAANNTTDNVSAGYCDGWCAYNCAQKAAVLASSTPRANMVTMCIPDFEQTINYVLNDENAVFPATAIKVPHSYISSDLPISLENAIPVRPYYTFDGWYDNANFEGTAITEILSGANQDITLYAKWSWSGCQDGSYLDSSTNTCETCPDGYISNGKTATSKNDCYVEWNCSENLAGCPQNATCTYIDPDHLSGIDYYGDTALHCEIDATCNTGYESNNGLCTAIEYDIQYVIPGGDFLNTLNSDSIPRKHTVESVIDLTGIVVVRSGYAFKGWYDNEDFEGSALTTLSNLQTDGITLYAKFEPIVCTVIYHDGDTESQKTYTEQEIINLIQPAAKSGYTFDGWCEDLNNCPELKNTLTASNGTINLYAKWSKIVCQDGKYLKNNQCLSCPRDYPYSNGATAVNATQCYREWSCDGSPVCPKNSENCAYANGTSGIEYYTLAIPRCKTTFTCKPGYVPMNNLLKGLEPDESDIQFGSKSFYGSVGQSHSTQSGSVNPNNKLPAYLSFVDTSHTTPFITLSLPPASWWTRFTYGTIVGHALCSAERGVNYQDYQWGIDNPELTATKTELESAGNGQYCWCQATGFSPDFDASQDFANLENMASPWFMIKDFSQDPNSCEGSCAATCGRMNDDRKFLSALYNSFSVANTVSSNADNANQTWSITMPHGVVSGESVCSSVVQGSLLGIYGIPRAYVANPDAGTLGPTCWCRATTYTPNNNSYTSFFDGVWSIANSVPDKTEYCQENCATLCLRAFSEDRNYYNYPRHFQIWEEDQACVPEQYAIMYHNVNTADVEWSNNTVKPSVYTTLDADIAIPRPNRTDYSFYGWCSFAEDANDPDSVCPETVTINTGSSGTVNLYAKWGAKKYNITYMNGNEPFAPLLTPYNYTESELPLDLPTNPYSADDTVVFDGWYNNPGLLGDAFTKIDTGSHTNRTFYVKWRPKYYNIKYMDGNTEITNLDPIPTTTADETTITLPSLEDRDGLTFIGWCDDAGLQENCSSTKTISASGTEEAKIFYAKWDKAVYTITYIDNNTNEIIADIEPNTYTIDDSVSLPENINKTHYNFLHLRDENNDVITTISQGSTGNKTLRAAFTPKTYTISFVPDNISNSEYNSINYTVEGLPTLPTPTNIKSGYSFNGFIDTETNEEINEITEANAADRTLAANYSYTNCGDGYATQLSNNAIWDTSKNGKAFYYTTNDGKYKKRQSTAPALSNGVWQTTFNTGSLVGRASCTDVSGDLPPDVMLASTADTQTSNLLSTSKYCWCILDSYNLTNTASNKVNIDNSQWVYFGDLNSNTVCVQGTNGEDSCVAQCAQAAKTDMRFRSQILGERSICTIALYDIIYDLNGGSFDDGIDVPEKTSMFYKDINLPQPERTAYTFAGWCDNAELTEGCQINKVISQGTDANVHVYAKWTPIDYHIIYNTNGGDLPDGISSPFVYHIDDTIDLPTPSKENYVFDGWYECSNFECESVTTWGPNEMVDNKEFWAKWNLESYTITYELRGGHFDNNESTTQEYDISNNSVTLQSPSKLGYTFLGWCVDTEACNQDDMASGTQTGWTGDKTLFANWSLDTYEIDYHNIEGSDWDESITPVTEYTIMDEYPIILPIPVKAGHDFAGWYTTEDLDEDENYPDFVNQIEYGTTGTKEFWAKWNCVAGYYSHDNTCSICPAGSYSEDNATECTLCAVGYTSTEGASACKICDNNTTNVTQWAQPLLNNENTEVSNTCKIQSCAEPGYEQIATFSLNQIPMLSHSVTINPETSAKVCRQNRTITNTCQNMSAFYWDTMYSYGTISGLSLCSAKDTSDTAPDNQITGYGSGTNCWCKIDAFTPVDGNTQNTQNSQWVNMNTSYVSVNACNAECATVCSMSEQNQRELMFNTTFDDNSMEVCALIKYAINYNGITEADWPEDALHPDYYTVKDSSVNIGNPTARQGYGFLGWCETDENCDNPQDNFVLNVDTLNLVSVNLYPKWECLEGYYNNNGVCSPCAVGSYSDTKDANQCTACEDGKTTLTEHATSCISCSNQENAASWASQTWDLNDNITNNLCRIASCDAGYTLESNEITGVATNENGIHSYCALFADSAVRCYKDWHIQNCSNEYFADIKKPYGWRVDFRYGSVTGTSVCSTTGSALNVANASQDIYDINTPDTTSEGGAYCWCKALDYDNQSLAGSWVFATDFSGAHATCENSCAMNCTGKVYRNSAFREVMFGNTYLNNTALNTLMFDEPLDKAMCVPKVFPIVYHNIDEVIWNNGENHPDFYTSLQNGVTIGRPTRQGFVFMGWCETENCVDETPQNNYSFTPSDKAEVQIDLYAQWTCAAGYYKNGSACIACPQDSYGIQYTSPNENTDGINSCYYLCEDVYEALCPPEHSIDCNYEGTPTDKNTYGDETNNCSISFNCETGYDKDENSCVLHAYHISYIDTIDNSSVTEDYTVEQLPLEKTVSPTDTHPGRTFMGWCENENDVNNAETTCSATITVNEVGDKTFYSRWNVNTYDIEYHNVEGTNLSTDSYTYGVEKVLPTPEKEGFRFIHWCDYDTTTQEVSNCGITSISTEETGNKYLYAQWGCVAGYYGDGTTCEQCPTETYPNSVEDDNATLEKCFVTCNAVENCPQSNFSVCHVTDYNEYYNANSTETCSSGVVCDDYYELNDGDCVATEYTVKFMDGDTLLREEPYTVETETIDGNINITHNPENNDATRTFYQWCEKENGEYINCVNGTTVTVNITTPRDITFYVKWACDNGYYSADGICTQCPIGYRNTDAGAARITDCYNEYTCPTECPPHAESCTPPTQATVKNYYGNGNLYYYGIYTIQTCDMDIVCEPGYEETKLGQAHGTGVSTAKLLNGSSQKYIYRDDTSIHVFDYTDWWPDTTQLGNNDAVSEYLNWVQDAERLSSGTTETVFDYYGTLRTKSTCDSESDQSKRTINNTAGENCWCKSTEHSLDGINFVTLDSPWIFKGRFQNHDECLAYCECSFSIPNVFSSTKVCKKKVFGIVFELNGGYLKSARSYSYGDYSKPFHDYTVENTPFNLPKPTRAGYDFAGWCNTAEDANNPQVSCPKDVLVTPSANDPELQTFYAKWVAVNCPEGQVVKTKFDPQKSPTSASFIEIDGSGTLGALLGRFDPDAPERFGLTERGTWATEYDYGTIYGEAVCKDAYLLWEKIFVPFSSPIPDEWFGIIPDTTETTAQQNYEKTCFCRRTGFKSRFGTLQPVSEVWSAGAPMGHTNCRNMCAGYCASGKIHYSTGPSNINYCAYTINYNGAEFPAGAVHPDSYDTGDTINIAVPVRDGYTFDGWCVGTDNCSNPQENFTITPETVGSVNLFAQWTANQYTITYNTMGANQTYQPETYTVGNIVFLPGPPSKSGYDFAGWCPVDVNCEAPITSLIWSGWTEDVTLYAVWLKTYQITYVFDNGTPNKTEKHYVGETVTFPSTPTKSGFSFAGWCVDTNCETPLTGTTHSGWENNITLTAKWTENSSQEFVCESNAWLHVGEDKACLAATPVEKPVLVIKGKKGTYYLKATRNSDLPMSKDTTKQLRMNLKGTVYNIHDETVTHEALSCDIPSTLVSTNVTTIGYKNDSTGNYGADSTNTNEYNLVEDNSWGVTWANGDKVTGIALCSSTDVLNLKPNTNESGINCWCKATYYTTNNVDQCSLQKGSWGWYGAFPGTDFCMYNCAGSCALGFRYDSNVSGPNFRAILLGSH